MRIWVDGQCFQTSSNVRGIGRYVFDLLSSILKAKPETQIIISLNGSMREQAVAAKAYLQEYLPECEIALWYAAANESEYKDGYTPQRKVDEQILAAHINAFDPDIALCPSPFEGQYDKASPFINPLDVKAKSVCVYYDAIPYRFPAIYLLDENAEKAYMRRHKCISKFDLVLCISKFTRSEYEEIFEKENAITIGAGLSQQLSELLIVSEVSCDGKASKLGNYVLCVGGMDWRKNIPLLVDAMALVQEEISDTLNLVLAGDRDPQKFEAIQRRWLDKGLSASNLISTGFTSDSGLIDLYRNATVAVQPSRMEGFGLTALEAWSCGCPFISARGGAVAEVVGSSEYLFSPDSARELADLIKRAVSEPDFRSDAIEYGAAMLGQYTWAKAAEIAYDAFVDLTGAKRKRLARKTSKSSQLEKRRLVVDVSSTIQSPVLSGIQRVMINLSDALQGSMNNEKFTTTLSYCRDGSGWYEVDALRKSKLSLSPARRFEIRERDTYLMLDSSWTFILGQRERLLDALLIGDDVVSGVYDLGPLTMSAMTDAGMPIAFRQWFEFALGMSTGLICISKSVADEVYELVQGIGYHRPLKIGYFPLGADFSDAEEDAKGLEMFDARPSFLMVGTVEPRKGHIVAIRAFEQLWREGVDVNLVVIGKEGWDIEMVARLLEHHAEAGKRLFWLKNGSDGNLKAAYRKAKALVMTSYLEGFGLPVVEAGKFGTPSILSDIPVFREVAKGAPSAIFFERGNPSALAAAIRDHMANEDPLGDFDSSWPTWKVSADEVKKVVMGGNWYRHYEPPALAPNALPSLNIDIAVKGKIKAPTDQFDAIRVIEGPFLSDRAQFLRIVVALTNRTETTWSSTGDVTGRYAICLGYHVYDRYGTCIGFDNPRVRIPFVVLPGQEIYLPVRVPTDWLTKGGVEVGIDVVQEGVAWFDEEIRVSLLAPMSDALGDHILPEAAQETDVNQMTVSYCRGPFASWPGEGDHYLFSILNSGSPFEVYNKEGEPRISVGIKDDEGRDTGGVWIENVAASIDQNNFGYLCLFVSKSANLVSGKIFIEISRGSGVQRWLFNPVERDIFIDAEDREQPISADNNRIDVLPEDVDLHADTVLRICEGEDVYVRGFNELEPTHGWMRGLRADVQLPENAIRGDDIRYLTVTCRSLRGLGNVSLCLTAEGISTDAVTVSDGRDLPYLFSVSRTMASALKRSGRIHLVTNKVGRADGDERDLSLAISSISLYCGAQAPILRNNSGKTSFFRRALELLNA